MPKIKTKSGAKKDLKSPDQEKSKESMLTKATF